MWELTMDDFAEFLEHELSEAVEVKNKDSLRRSVQLLATNMVEKHQYDSQMSGIRSDIQSVTDTMKQGFEHMEQRFEDMNRRFDDVNRRFEDVNQRFRMMFTFITIGFTVLATMSVLFKFLA
jgi:hypothetical protein